MWWARSSSATRRTFAEPKTASFHGAKVKSGGTVARPTRSECASSTFRGVAPKKRWKVRVPSQFSTRMAPGSSEHMWKRLRWSVSAISPKSRLETKKGTGK